LPKQYSQLKAATNPLPTVFLQVIAVQKRFHLFTSLGDRVIIDKAGNRDDGQLFAMAVGVFLASLRFLWLCRERL